MNYNLIEPPFSLNFSKFSKGESESYFEWVRSVSDYRLAELIAEVSRTALSEEWTANYSPTSLRVLGEWFAGNISVRDRSIQEISNLQSKMYYPIETPDYELTDTTFSLAFDIGLYLGEVFVRNNSSLKWGYSFRRKTSVNYGQPVIFGFGDMELNPIRIVVVLAYGIVSRRDDSSGLYSIYEKWSNIK